MGGMATEPPIGTRIRRARERQHWTQQQLADAVSVNVKTVNNWETGRTLPASRLGAIEEVLGVDLSNGAPAENYEDPAEAEIWGLTLLTEAERRAAIAALRAKRQPRAG